MNFFFAMAVMAATTGPAATGDASLTGWLRIDGRAPVVTATGCIGPSDVLASVVFVDVASGAAVERVDVTCARKNLSFEAQLAPGKYRAVAWPALDATNLVPRPYAFDQVIEVTTGHSVVTLEELTAPVQASVRATCVRGTSVELVDTVEPYSQTVQARCSDNTLRFTTRLPRGSYRVQVGEVTRAKLEVTSSKVAMIDLDDERLVQR